MNIINLNFGMKSEMERKTIAVIDATFVVAKKKDSGLYGTEYFFQAYFSQLQELCL